MNKQINEIACVFCGAKNTAKLNTCSECCEPLNVAEHFFGSTIAGYTLDTLKGRGFYGLTFKAHDRFRKPVAIKLISCVSYKRYGKDFSCEAEIYANLPDHPSIVGYIQAGDIKLPYKDRSMDFYFIITQWIEGNTLNDFLDNTMVTPEDLIVFAKDILSGLEELYNLKLWHNDLHDENIMVSSLTPSQVRLSARSVPRKYVIIDVGSMVFRNPHDVKEYGDLQNTGIHLSRLVNKLEILGNMTKEDQYFTELIQEICTQLTDEHPGRSLSRPIAALDRIEEIYRSSRLGESAPIKELDSPYGYINANDIPSPWLLKEMFSDKLRYFRDVMTMTEQCLLITGPRGSGKTMLLKNMRFKTSYDSKESTPEEYLKEISYIGLFVSARTNFGNMLVSYRPQAWAQDEAKILYYFNLLVTMELVDVLYRLNFDHIANQDVVNTIVEFISQRFDLGNIGLLTVKSRLISLSRRLVNDEEVKLTNVSSTPSYLNDLITLFKSAIAPIRDKEVIILIDDLSLPRIPSYIQKSVIPVIFNTGASYKVRVTSHSDGLVTQDIGGEMYQANRDFREINLGFEYWQLSDDYRTCNECFNDIMKKRFQLSGRDPFRGIETVLGVGENLEDIGREIHRLSMEKKLRTLRYHGAKVFIKLCSGDLSYLLDILGKMESRNLSEELPVPVKIQSDVIRNYSRNELLLLQDIRAANSVSLYDIAYYFGVWSKSKLVKKDADYIKIELELQNLSRELRQTQIDLLCYGVFIDGGYSNMNDGSLARRLLFRRIFTPAFPTTFNSRNTFPMRAPAFKKFITDPKNFIREKMSEDGLSPVEQQEMEQLEMDFG